MNLLDIFRRKPADKDAAFLRRFHKILLEKIPTASIPYILELWQQQHFRFTMPYTRSTCLGNYRFRNGKHTVSVNADLNPYSFLITLIHEIAHYHATLKYNGVLKKIDPHGSEWKDTFKVLIEPVLVPEIFPEDILPTLKRHMKNPAASSMSDPLLVKALKFYDEKAPGNIQHLGDIASGTVFVFNKKVFKKIENRRSRVLVEDPKTKKRYTIPVFADVLISDLNQNHTSLS
jgi:SprT protein